MWSKKQNTEMNKFTITAGDFNTPLPLTDRITRQKKNQ